ncbi:MAG: hypothetical protein QXU32_03565 [Nitrososphaerales archaeon]
MNKLLLGLGVLAVVSTVIAISMATMARSAEPQVGHDSVTVLLTHKRIPAGDFIHLYDSTPMPIGSGHFAVKVDCDKDGKGIVSIALGVAPDMEIIPLTMDNMVHDLSTHGQMCIYHIDLPPEQGMAVTDLAVINTSKSPIRLGPTATAVIHVHSFGEAMEHEEHGGM